MCCDLPAALRWPRAAAACVLATIVIGCGHKDDPLPPHLRFPAYVTDLEVAQRGAEFVLTFTYPQTTAGGLPLPGIEKVEVWEMTREVPAWEAPGADEEGDDGETDEPADAQLPGAAVPSDAGNGEEEDGDSEEGDGEERPMPAKEELVTVEPVEFSLVASNRLTLAGEELEAATLGDEIVVRLPLEAGDETVELAHVYAVKTYAEVPRPSDLSNLAKIVRRPTLPPPAGFRATAGPDGVDLAWEGRDEEEEDEDGEAPAAVGDGTEGALKGYRVYRRLAASRIYGDPIATLPTSADGYLDRQVKLGQRYIYAVSAVSETRPLVESAFGAEREVDYEDRFGPRPPTNLIALPEPGRVRLLWDASPDDDVAGYLVYRRPLGGEFAQVTPEATVELEWSDRGLEGGAIFEYRVVALDERGNRSDPSELAVARVP